MHIAPIKKLNHFIPEIFLSTSNRTISINNKSKTLNLDYLADLFHSFYIKYLRLKEVENQTEVTLNLSTTILREKFGNKYKYYVQFLIDNEIISLKRNYIAGSSCRIYQFRLSCLRNHKIIPYQNKCWKLINHYNSKNDDDNEIYGINLRKWIKSNLTHISLDYEKARRYLKEEFPDKTLRKYTMNIHSIQNIEDGNIYVTFDKYGRVHTNFTVLKKKIRNEFLFIDGEPIYEVDISNSQALFFLLLLSGNLDETINRSELRRFKHYNINGTFYDNLSELYNRPRADIKLKFFKYLFGIIHQGFPEFEEEYPSIHKFLKNYKKSLGDYKLLAQKLQGLEGEFVFNEVCKGLYKVKVKFFTVHDSICVPEKNKSILDEIFEEKITGLVQRIEDNISNFYIDNN